MKRTHKILAGLALVLGLGAAAYAQPGMGFMPGCEGMGPMEKMGRHAAMKFDPAQRAAERLDYLKYQLKITPEQEPLWNAYAEEAKAEAGKGFQALRARGMDDTLPAPERLAKMEKLLEERLAAMKAVHERFNRLYAALTPEQKAIADQQMAHPAKVGRKGPGRMAPSAAPQG